MSCCKSRAQVRCGGANLSPQHLRGCFKVYVSSRPAWVAKGALGFCSCFLFVVFVSRSAVGSDGKGACCPAWQSEFGPWDPNGGTDPHKLPLTSTRASCMPTHPDVLHMCLTHTCPPTYTCLTHASYTHMPTHLHVLHTRLTHTLIIPFDKMKTKVPLRATPLE